MPTDRKLFKCPECEDNYLEEVTKAIAYTTISGFYNRYEQYDETDTEYLNVLRTQCMGCGFIVYEGACHNLFQHCVDRGWIEGMDSTPDWEV
jgi:hypothetical protein